MKRSIVFRALRDPLVHFLIPGAGIFLIYFMVNGRAGVPSEHIVVDQNQSLRLAGQFQRTWMRPPTWQELQALTEDFVREEILYREAQALGLDQNDLVMRRRLSQKMEFVGTDLIEQQAPTDAELQSFLAANKDKFLLPDRFSFQQVYLNPNRSAGNVKRAPARLLVRLNAEPGLEADPKLIGDATMLPRKLDVVTLREVDNVFGVLHGLGFAGALREIGLPDHAIPLSLAFFNVGVEVGQLLFVAAVLLLFSALNQLMRRRALAGLRLSWPGAIVTRTTSYVIGTLAAFWLIERTYGLFI